MFRASSPSGSFDPASVSTRPMASVSRKKAEKETARDQKRLARWQERLSAEGKRSLLLVLQGMDTSGKDGTIKHVLSSMNPQGVRVAAFKVPTETESKHHFLWRIRKELPRPGEVAVFNRSHYEDVLVAKVDELVPKEELEPRFDSINRFEKGLVARGTTVVKVFLNISFEEQRLRLLARLEDPTKQWKFSPGDLRKRAQWPEYQDAYSEAISRCSIDAAPWYVVPADAKWFRNWLIGRLLVETFEDLDPRYPTPALDLRALTAQLEP
jgi:PPK2 family polyphosphate:nucleotide phosphotransferase